MEKNIEEKSEDINDFCEIKEILCSISGNHNRLCYVL